jgi:hypothetical protein
MWIVAELPHGDTGKILKRAIKGAAAVLALPPPHHFGPGPRIAVVFARRGERRDPAQSEATVPGKVMAHAREPDEAGARLLASAPPPLRYKRVMACG